jgi:hypothetical protein
MWLGGGAAEAVAASSRPARTAINPRLANKLRLFNVTVFIVLYSPSCYP